MKKLILLFVLSSLFLTACQEQNNEQTKAASMKVNVVQVQPVTLTQTLRLSGSITVKEDVAVGTVLLGLQIQTVNVDVGDVVKKGQVLATLKRYQTLMKSDAISRQELEQQQAKARAAVQAANTEIDQGQAQLDDSRYQRKKAEVLDQTTSGQIRLLSSQIDQTSRTGKVHIQLQTPVQTTLPLSAVHFNADGTAFVMVVNRNQQIERRPISLGEVNQSTAEILSGLKVGEQVVQKAGTLINEGDRVEPKNDRAAL